MRLPQGVVPEATCLQGSRVALAMKKKVYIVHLEDLASATALTLPSRWVSGMAQLSFRHDAPSGSILATSCGPGVFVWDVLKGTIVQEWKDGHKRPIRNISWSGDGTGRLATCADDKTIRLLDMRQPTAIVNLQCQASAALVEWCPKGSKLVSSHVGNVKVWDLRIGKIVEHITAHTGAIHSLEFSPYTEDELMTCGSEQVSFWNINSPRKTKFSLQLESITKAQYTSFAGGLLTSTPSKQRLGTKEVLQWRLERIAANDPSPVAAFEATGPFSSNRDSDSPYPVVLWTKSGLHVVPLEEMGTVSSASQVGAPRRGQQTLGQELKQVRLAEIPNIKFRAASELERSCEVIGSVGTGPTKIVATLKITFPQIYPNDAPPSFTFAQPCALGAEVQKDLKEKLSRTAETLVAEKSGCLEACLVTFVTGLNDWHRSLKRGMRAGGSGGYYAMPRPRVCGAVFNPSGLIVTFRNSKTTQTFNLGSSVIRSGSETGGPIVSTSPGRTRPITSPARSRSDSDNYSNKYRGKKSKRFNRSVPGEIGSEVKRKPEMCIIADVCELMSLSKQLGSDYMLEGDIDEVASHNRRAAMEAHRSDLVRCWALLGQSLSHPPPLQNLTKDDFGTWIHHPLVGGLALSLVRHYLKQKDIQTVAMLICASSRPFSNNFAISLKTYFEAEMSNEEFRECMAYVRMYSNVLFAWENTDGATKVRWYVESTPSLPCLEFVSICESCGKQLSTPRCPDCNIHGTRCSICRVSVKQNLMLCPRCGHGGHSDHLAMWFRENKICPTGCGCVCVD